MVLGRHSVPGCPADWITIGQGPAALAGGAAGVVWTFFSPLPFLFSLSLSLGDGPILTATLSQRALNPKQPTNQSRASLQYNMIRFRSQEQQLEGFIVIK